MQSQKLAIKLRDITNEHKIFTTKTMKSFSIKINTGYVSSIRTRNSTRENIIYKCSSKVILSFIVPSTQAAFAIFIAREILCFKKLPALGSSVHMLRFLQSLLIKFELGAAAP